MEIDSQNIKRLGQTGKNGEKKGCFNGRVGAALKILAPGEGTSKNYTNPG